MKQGLEKETPRIAEVIKVIHTVATRGVGTEDNPVRVVHQYWSLSGELLAEKDQC